MVEVIDPRKFDTPWVGKPDNMLTLRASARVPLARSLANRVLPYKWEDKLIFLQLACVGDVKVKTEYFVLRARAMRTLVEFIRPEICVELGSGFSLNGFILSSMGLPYFETDLQSVAETKAEAAPSIIGSSNPYHIQSLDVSKNEAVIDFLERLPKKRPSIVLEALLPWISAEAKKALLPALAKHLRSVGGGTVIVSDVYLTDLMAKNLEDSLAQLISASSTQEELVVGLMYLEMQVEKRLKLVTFDSFQSAWEAFAAMGFRVRIVDLDNPLGAIRQDTSSCKGSGAGLIWVLEI